MTFARFWQWIDDRDIDKHLVALVILWYMRANITWAMAFAEAHPDSPQAAMIIAAVMAPYMAAEAYALKLYFEARSTPT